MTKIRILKWFVLWEPLAYAFIGMAFLAMFQFSTPFLLDQDGYFHIKVAELWLEQGYLTKLPWMSEAIMADHYVDFHLLFQFLFLPFLFFISDPIVAYKLGTILSFGASTASLIWVLRKLGTKYRWFYFLFFLLGSHLFFLRVLFGRGMILFLGIYFLFVYFHIRKRWLPVFLLSWVVMYIYPSFLVLLATSLFLVIGHWREKDLSLSVTAFACLGGVLLGIFLHPSFPYQFKGYWLEVGGRFFHPMNLEETGEWSPPAKVISMSSVLFPVSVLTFLILVGRNFSSRFLSFYAFSVLLLIQFFQASRSIEYLLPVALLCSAFYPIRTLPLLIRQGFLVAGSAILILWSAPKILQDYRHTLAQADISLDFEAADWLEKNSEKGSKVLLSWDRFPRFFYRNTHNYYYNGMNPIYSFAKDPSRHSLARSFLEGSAENLHLIPAFLGFSYSVLEIAPHNAKAIETIFKSINSGDKNVEKVWENARYVIFKFKSMNQSNIEPKSK